MQFSLSLEANHKRRVAFCVALTLIGTSYASKKNAHLGAFFVGLNELTLTRLMSIFNSKKVWEFLVKIQLTKSDPKRTGGGKCSASCQLGLKREPMESIIYEIDCLIVFQTNKQN